MSTIDSRRRLLNTGKVALLGCVGWCWDPADRQMHIDMLTRRLGGVATVEAAVLGDDDAVRRALAGAQAVCALEFKPEMLNDAEAMPVLVQSPGSGTDRISTSGLPPGIHVCNAGAHETAMAEYLMLGMLAHAHDFVEAQSSFKDDGVWRMSGRLGGPLHRELSSATVGIVGLGLAGRSTAARASAFGMRVLGCNRTTSLEVAGLSEPIYPLARLVEMIARCDYLCLTIALTPETRGLVDARALARAKPGCVLLNVARAELVDEQALYQALAAGHLGGALLDVWWRYPTRDDPECRPSAWPFHELPPTTMMTPHASCWSSEMLERRWDGIAANLRAAVIGDIGALTHVVWRGRDG